MTTEDEFRELAEQQAVQDELDQQCRDRMTEYGGREALDREIELAEVPYWKIREAVRQAVGEKVEELFKPTADELLEGEIDLLDRMLPPAPLQPPVIENAEVIFGVSA